MKILLTAPLRRRVSAEITASRPRFIFDLATNLIKKNYDVAILGTGDSYVEGATIIPIIEKGINALPPFENPFYAELSFLTQMTAKIKNLASQFDIIHNHAYPEFAPLFITDLIKIPVITTIHAPATPELDQALSLFPHTLLVCPSEAQKKHLPMSTISAVIPHGTDIKNYSFSPQSDDYLLWIGRLGKAKDENGEFIDGKGVRLAIKVAQTTNKKLFMTGNIEDKKFFEKDVSPYLNSTIQWLGGVSTEQPMSKTEIAGLMQNAKALLITTRFDESFGLTAIEAGSCGTPIIGFDKGAIPEIVHDGITGFVIKSELGVDGLSDAVKSLYALSSQEYSQMRKDSRDRIALHYSLEKMTENYIALYEGSLRKD